MELELGEVCCVVWRCSALWTLISHQTLLKFAESQGLSQDAALRCVAFRSRILAAVSLEANQIIGILGEPECGEFGGVAGIEQAPFEVDRLGSGVFPIDLQRYQKIFLPMQPVDFADADRATEQVGASHAGNRERIVSAE